MRYIITDKKYRFKSAFDTETGAYVRTGELDECGKDTGVDPFMASYPHLIDVGIMGHCIHGKTGLCAKAGIGCYQSGMLVEHPNMSVEDFKWIAEQDEHRAILASLGLFKFADKKAQKQAILSLQEQIDAFRSTERLEKQRNEWESIASTAVKVYEKQVKAYIAKRFPKAFEKRLPPFAVGSRAKPPKDETIQQRNERMRWRALDALNKMNKIATVDDFEKVFPSWSSNQLRTTWVRSNVPYYVTRSVDKGKAFFEITEEGKKALQEEYDKQPADYTENPEFADLACPEPKDPTF